MKTPPVPGLVLRHVEIDQKIVVDRRLEIGGMVFWEVTLSSHSVTPESHWWIHEPCLMEQYEAIPTR